MEQFLAFEVWVASLAAASAIGWLIGEAQGAASLHASGDLDLAIGTNDEAGELESLFTLSVPPKSVPSKLVPKSALAKQTPSTTPTSETPQQRSFRKVPSITALRVEAEQIRAREPVWDVPDISDGLTEFMRVADQGSLDLMDHYRRSVEELRALNRATGQSKVPSNLRANVQARPHEPISPSGRQMTAPPRNRSARQAELPFGSGPHPDRRAQGMIEVQTRGNDQADPKVPPAHLRYFG